MHPNSPSINSALPRPAEIAGLLEQRDRLVRERERLDEISHRVRAAESAVAAVEAEIAGAEQESRAAFDKWVSSGGEGNPPEPNWERRRELDDRRLQGLSAVYHARLDAVDIKQPRRIKAIDTELRDLGDAIFCVRVNEVLEAAKTARAAADEAAQVLVENCMILDSIRDALRDALTVAAGARSEDRLAARLQAAIVRLVHHRPRAADPP